MYHTYLVHFCYKITVFLNNCFNLREDKCDIQADIPDTLLDFKNDTVLLGD